MVLIVAFLAAGHAIRSAVVAKLGDSEPAKAALVWPGHPVVKLNLASADIASAAARGEEPPVATVEQAIAVSGRAPLAAGPFLVRGTFAQVAGDVTTAEQAFLEARRRNPRERAARYFLADHYLKTGRIAAGLKELAILARLVPTGDIAPFVATFARTPGAVPELKRLFADQPDLEAPVLSQLASDAANADLIVTIASPRAYRVHRRNEWLPNLLNALVDKGDFARAYRLWQRASGIERREPIFDREFAGSPAPAPFNWSFLSSSAGFAEPAGGGTLRVIYYGRDNAVLASQLLLLDAGTFILSNRVTGSREAADLLSWVLTCLPGGQPLAQLPLQVRPDQALTARFEVGGPNCRAQRLDLSGRAPEFPQQVDVVISDLNISRVEP